LFVNEIRSYVVVFSGFRTYYRSANLMLGAILTVKMVKKRVLSLEQWVASY